MSFSFSIIGIGNEKVGVNLDAGNGISTDELNRILIAAFEELQNDCPEFVMAVTLCSLQVNVNANSNFLDSLLQTLNNEKSNISTHSVED